MGAFWNRQTKRLAWVFLLAGMVMLVLVNLTCLTFRRRMNHENNWMMAGILCEVREKYPEVSEEELFGLLDNARDSEARLKLLRQRGIFEQNGDALLGGQERLGRGLCRSMNVLFVLFFLTFSAVTFRSLHRRKKEVDILCRYVNELERGNYVLEVEQNDTGELSGLKNELYKLTVLFREQAEHARANRTALAETVADISHQLKTPLTSVMVLSDNLLENEGMDEQTRQRFLREINVQLNGMKWLVTTLLKLSRFDAGVVELARSPIDVEDLFQAVLQKVELLAEWKQVELVPDVGEKVSLTGDAYWMTEALTNVVKNAIEHSSPGSAVRFSTEENDVYTLIRISDSGGGMDREEMRHLFERYWRGKGASSENAGLGLALAKEVIERQGGYIAVESSEAGTVFFIKFLKCH